MTIFFFLSFVFIQELWKLQIVYFVIIKIYYYVTLLIIWIHFKIFISLLKWLQGSHKRFQADVSLEGCVDLGAIQGDPLQLIRFYPPCILIRTPVVIICAICKVVWNKSAISTLTSYMWILNAKKISLTVILDWRLLNLNDFNLKII